MELEVDLDAEIKELIERYNNKISKIINHLQSEFYQLVPST